MAMLSSRASRIGANEIDASEPAPPWTAFRAAALAANRSSGARLALPAFTAAGMWPSARRYARAERAAPAASPTDREPPRGGAPVSIGPSGAETSTASGSDPASAQRSRLPKTPVSISAGETAPTALRA